MKRGSATNRNLIERIAAIVPGFNQTPLGLDELYYQCDHRGICALEGPLRKLHGCSFWDECGPCLVVNSLISHPARIIAGWHEFKHLVVDMQDGPTLFSHGGLMNYRKIERQAQIVGVLALMPDSEAWGLNMAELMERYDVTETIARFRLELMF